MPDASPPPRARVLIVVGALGRGGAERQAVLAARALHAAGAHAELFVAQPPLSLLGEARVLGVPVHAPERKEGVLAQARRLKRVVTVARPNAIVTFLLSAANRMLLVRTLSRKVRAVPWIASVRGNHRARDFLTKPIHMSAGVAALRSADAVVVNSASLAANLLSYDGSLSPKLSIIPNVLLPFEANEGTATGEAAAYVTKPGRPLLGAIGSFQEARNYDVLIAALPLVLRQHPDAHLLVFGRTTGRDCGPVAARAREAARALGVAGRITFAGEVPDARRIIPAFDVFVLPSKLEGSSNGLAEAILSGAAIAAAPVADAPELLLGAGVLSSGWSTREMADAILAALDARDDLRARATARRARLIDERSPERVGALWAALVQSSGGTESFSA